MAKDYKLGVVLFPTASIDSDLDRIKNEIAKGDVYREFNGDTLQLVVQLQIPWNETNSAENVYDFSKYKQIAEKMKARGIKWTPLFPIHHTPNWVLNKYSSDLMKNKHSQLPSDGKYGNFLDFSPSSSVWRNEAHKWIQKGIEELSNYIGVDKNSTISELFITNESMYRRGGLSYGDAIDLTMNTNDSVITTYDNTTINKWNNSSYGKKYGSIPRNISYNMDSESRINAFLRFRSEELAYMLSDLRNSAKSKLIQLNKQSIPVTWKLTPYVFDAGKTTLEQYNGINSYGLDILFNKTGVEVIGMDEYSSPNSLDSSNFIASINKIRKYDKYKPIYMAEFNRRDSKPDYSLVRKWIKDTKAYDVRYWTFFSWNGGVGQTGKPAHESPIEPQQIQGLQLAFDDLIPPDGTGNDPKPIINSDVVYTTGGNYGNNQSISKNLSIPNATIIEVSVIGSLERNFDYIYIYNGSSLVKSITGDSNQKFTLNTNNINIIFTSDSSVSTSNGMTVSISKIK